MGTSGAFSYGLYRIGAVAGLFSSGALTGILVERKGDVKGFMEPFGMEKPLRNHVHIETLNPKIARGQSILKYGIPQSLSPGVLYHENHVLELDPIRKTPIWVAEHITQHHVEPEKPLANRKKSKFRPDNRVDESIRPSNDDYSDSGWSRGHMAPAGNNKHCQEAMDDTFLLSNIVPQDFDNNGDFWNRTEIYCRNLTKQFSDVRVISGPLWLPLDDKNETTNQQNQEEAKLQQRMLPNGRPCKNHKIVRYPVIGQNEVAVPTHLYKIIMAEDQSLETPLMSAFIVPNRPIAKDKALAEFKVPLIDLERKVGLRFHSRLDRKSVKDLCSVEGCLLLRYRDFQAYFIHRGIKNARNTNELERYWRQAKKYDLASDDEIQKVYNTRRNELQENTPTPKVLKNNDIVQSDVNKKIHQESCVSEEMENPSKYITKGVSDKIGVASSASPVDQERRVTAAATVS